MAIWTLDLDKDQILIEDNRTFKFATEASITKFQALKDIIKTSAPSWSALLLRRIVELSNYIVVGRLGNSDYIAGVGLAIVTWGLSWFSIGIGLSGALDTLWSQAFGNNNNYLAGCYYNRGQVILTLIFIPQAVILFFSSDILIWIGQDENVSNISGSYLLIVIPGIWAYWQTELLRRFLGAQGVFHLLFKIQILTTFLHIFWLFIFVYWFELSITGVSVSTWITYILTFTLSSIYTGWVIKNGNFCNKKWEFCNRN